MGPRQSRGCWGFGGSRGESWKDSWEGSDVPPNEKSFGRQGDVGGEVERLTSDRKVAGLVPSLPAPRGERFAVLPMGMGWRLARSEFWDHAEPRVQNSPGSRTAPGPEQRHTAFTFRPF